MDEKEDAIVALKVMIDKHRSSGFLCLSNSASIGQIDIKRFMIICCIRSHQVIAKMLKMMVSMFYPFGKIKENYSLFYHPLLVKSIRFPHLIRWPRDFSLRRRMLLPRRGQVQIVQNWISCCSCRRIFINWNNSNVMPAGKETHQPRRRIQCLLKNHSAQFQSNSGSTLTIAMVIQRQRMRTFYWTNFLLFTAREPTDWSLYHHYFLEHFSKLTIDSFLGRLNKHKNDIADELKAYSKSSIDELRYRLR